MIREARASLRDLKFRRNILTFAWSVTGMAVITIPWNLEASLGHLGLAFFSISFLAVVSKRSAALSRARLATRFARSIIPGAKVVEQNCQNLLSQLDDIEWAVIGLNSGWGDTKYSGPDFILFEEYLVHFGLSGKNEGRIVDANATLKDKQKLKFVKSGLSIITTHHTPESIEPWSESEVHQEGNYEWTGKVLVKISGPHVKVKISFRSLEDAIEFKEVFDSLKPTAAKQLKRNPKRAIEELRKTLSLFDELGSALNRFVKDIRAIMDDEVAEKLIGPVFLQLLERQLAISESISKLTMLKSASE